MTTNGMGAFVVMLLLAGAIGLAVTIGLAIVGFRSARAEPGAPVSAWRRRFVFALLALALMLASMAAYEIRDLPGLVSGGAALAALAGVIAILRATIRDRQPLAPLVLIALAIVGLSLFAYRDEIRWAMEEPPPEEEPDDESWRIEASEEAAREDTQLADDEDGALYEEP